MPWLKIDIWVWVHGRRCGLVLPPCRVFAGPRRNRFPGLNANGEAKDHSTGICPGHGGGQFSSLILCIAYFVSLRQLAKDSAQLDFWGQYSPPQGFAHAVGWLFDVFAASVRDSAGLAGVPGMTFFVVGVAALFRTNRGPGWMVCGSCIATLLATFAHRDHWAAGCCHSRLRS